MSATKIQAREAAEAIFRAVTPQERVDAMTEYHVRQQATLERMARLRAMRLAREEMQKGSPR
jgi:hypothetical protein